MFRFLAAAAKEIGVTANEPHNGLACARPSDQQLVQCGRRIATADKFGRVRRQAEDLGIYQPVMEHHISASKQFCGAQREQSSVARSRPNQINHAFWLHRWILYAESSRAAIEQRSGFTDGHSERFRTRRDAFSQRCHKWAIPKGLHHSAHQDG